MKERVRAVLVTRRNTLLVMKRTRSGAEPYWVIVGGGVEPADASREDALLREVREEIGGQAEIVGWLHELKNRPGERELFFGAFGLLATNRTITALVASGHIASRLHQAIPAVAVLNHLRDRYPKAATAVRGYCGEAPSYRVPEDLMAYGMPPSATKGGAACGRIKHARDHSRATQRRPPP